MRPSPFQGSLRILRGSVVLNQEGHAALASEDDGELIRGQIQLVAIAQVVLAVAAAIGLIYLLKLVMVTILCSLLLAFALDPLVVLLARVRVPRSLGAAVALFLLLALFAGLTLFFYNRATDFLDQLPQYSSTIRKGAAQA